jgi:hypothetical protein
MIAGGALIGLVVLILMVRSCRKRSGRTSPSAYSVENEGETGKKQGGFVSMEITDFGAQQT